MIILRKATLEDKEAIAKLWRKESAFLGALYMAALKERIEKGSVNIALVDGIVAGFAEYRHRKDGVNVIYHIAVDNQYRRKGLGFDLLQSVGLPLRLKVTADNQGAITFYQAYGMKLVAGDIASTGRALCVFEMQS